VLIETIPVGPLQSNCVIIACSETKEGFVVDPGGDSQVILNRIDVLGVRVVEILLTHAHIDHFGVAASVSKRLGVPVVIHPRDIPLYDTGFQQAGLLGLPAEEPPAPKADLEDGQIRNYGRTIQVKVLHTPGHSPGSVCFLVEERNGDGTGEDRESRPPILLSGDTLFRRGVGRTDLPGGDHRRLLQSIRERLYALGDNIEVIPGHGPMTTIGEERRENPWVAADK